MLLNSSMIFVFQDQWWFQRAVCKIEYVYKKIHIKIFKY